MGGGVAHGPKPRSHEMRVNKKMRRLALRSALTDAALSGKLAVVQGLAFDGPRTKDAVAVLEALGLVGRILLVLPGPDDAAERSGKEPERGEQHDRERQPRLGYDA